MTCLWEEVKTVLRDCGLLKTVQKQYVEMING
jgi:hypothetical protein